jgi:DNA polymerase-3 subunit beta
MKIIIQQDKLKSLLTEAASVISQNIDAVQSAVLLEAKNGKLIISSTNITVSYSRGVECQVVADGVACVTAKRLLAIIGNVDSSTLIELEVASGKLKVGFNKSKYSLGIFKASDFPSLPQPKKTGINVSVVDLQLIINHVRFGVTDEPSRHTLNAVKLFVGENYLKAATTNGYQVALASIGTESQHESCLMTDDVIGAIMRLQNIDILSFTQNENQIFFTANDFVLSASKLSGGFPNYGFILDKRANNGEVSFNSKDIRDSVARSLNIMDLDSLGIFLDITNNSVIVQADQATGECRDVIDATSTLETKIKVNQFFLQNALRPITSEKLTIILDESNQSICTIKPYGDYPINFECVLFLMNDIKAKAKESGANE